jgi:hypothetical protein
MNDIQTRFVMFLFGCILVRFLFAYAAKVIDTKYLHYMGYLALLPAFGLSYIYLNGLRKTGREVLGSKIWWNMLRPLHAALYFLFAYYAINEDSRAYIYLVIDVVIGLLSFLSYHLYEGNFKKIFS